MGRLTPIVVKALISADCAGSSQKDPSKFLSFREELLLAVDGNECGNITIDVCACRQEALRYQIAVLPASHSIDTGFRPPDHSTKAELQSAVPAASPRLAAFSIGLRLAALPALAAPRAAASRPAPGGAGELAAGNRILPPLSRDHGGCPTAARWR